MLLHQIWFHNEFNFSALRIVTGVTTIATLAEAYVCYTFQESTDAFIAWGINSKTKGNEGGEVG